VSVTNDLLFRVIFSTLWLIFIANLTWVRYSLRDPKSRSSIDQTAGHERRLHIVALALFAPFWFGGIILYAILPSWIMFLSIPLPDWFRLIMVGVAALSIPFTLWAYRTLGKNWAHALDPSKFLQRKRERLVTSGPYRYVRNPIYLGAFVFIIALALVAANWLLLLPALVLITIIYAQIGKEELMLIDRFGDDYRQYMKRTPRLIPKFRHEHSTVNSEGTRRLNTSNRSRSSRGTVGGDDDHSKEPEGFPL
jgi:protein-S-isoprenylcysteine O-methyltransferase Ste14